MDVFSTTPAPFNSPPVGFVCSSFEKCIAGALITLARAGRGQEEGWRDDRSISSGKGWLVLWLILFWFFGWGIKDKTSELEVKVHKLKT